MPTIPLKLDDADLRKIDYLVKKGQYKNRSHAIRNLLIEQLNSILIPLEWQEEESDKNIDEVVRKLLNLPKQNIVIKSDEPISKIVQEERERY